MARGECPRRVFSPCMCAGPPIFDTIASHAFLSLGSNDWNGPDDWNQPGDWNGHHGAATGDRRPYTRILGAARVAIPDTDRAPGRATETGATTDTTAMARARAARAEATATATVRMDPDGTMETGAASDTVASPGGTAARAEDTVEATVVATGEDMGTAEDTDTAEATVATTVEAADTVKDTVVDTDTIPGELLYFDTAPAGLNWSAGKLFHRRAETPVYAGRSGKLFTGEPKLQARASGAAVYDGPGGLGL